MPDPGYGDNGEYTAPSGKVDWEAQAPPALANVPALNNVLFPLGETELPFLDLLDMEIWLVHEPER